MNNLRATQVITDLFEQLRDRDKLDILQWDRPDIAMYTCIQINSENHGYEADGNTHHPEWQSRVSRMIHVIITSRNRVYLAITDNHPDYKIEKLDPSLFKNTSNHSSCWRSDGLDQIDSVIRDSVFETIETTPEGPHRDTFAEGLHGMFNNFGDGFISHEPISIVSVTCGDYVDDNRYRDCLTSIKKMKVKMVLVEEARNASES